MEQPVRKEGAAASTSESSTIPPYLLSRDYEDYLDWLENQRRTRTGRRVGRHWFGALSVFAAAFSLAGAMLRRR
jgi:hypothetical protein